MLAFMAFGVSFSNTYAQEHVTTLSPGQSITAKTSFVTAAAGFQWYRNGVAIPGAVNATYVINVPGVYSVRAFNLESCPSPMSELFEVRLVAPLAVNPDVSVVKVSESKQVAVGEPFDYLLTVKNRSMVTATNVVVTDALPSMLEYVSTSPGTGNQGSTLYDPASRTLSWNVGDLAPGDASNLTLTVKSRQSGNVANTATVKENEADFNNVNNTSTDNKTINPLSIPNVITPNGDGKNEQFVIPDILATVVNEIQIFNRWGNLVYEKKNYHNEWTGNGLSEGTYYYILKAQSNTGTWDIYKGYVTLLRTKQL